MMIRVMREDAPLLDTYDDKLHLLEQAHKEQLMQPRV